MPNLHPLLTHFPVALLSFAILAEWAARGFAREELSRAGWWTQAAGSLALAAAAVTGLLASDDVTMLPGGRACLDVHEQIAFVACTVFAALLFWRIAARTKLPAGRETAYLLIFTAGVLTLLAAAWYGGELVFRFGAGVQAISPPLPGAH
ncbi:MAG TPA: DUF2231 domain-containing protein [Bacteroidota bacterium]|nr:DUF2231 domain-containing protein [Bacteroidota bacterium]